LSDGIPSIAPWSGMGELHAIKLGADRLAGVKLSDTS
jgi:hypothetical protein